MANYNDYLEYLKHIDNTTEQEIKTKIDGLNEEISNLKTSLSNLNKFKDDLTTDLANAKKQINEKVDLINLKETELKKVTSELANVQKELKDTSFKLTELGKLHNIEQKKNATISNELAEVKNKYSVLENEVKTKNKSVNDYIVEIQKLHLDLENAKKDFKNASDSNTSTNEQIRKIQNEKEELRVKLNNQIIELNKSKKELEKKLNDANNENSSGEVERLKIDLQELKNLNSQLSNQNQEITKEFEEKEKAINYQIKKEQTDFKDYKGNVKTYLWLLGIACICFLGGMIYNISEKNNYKNSYESEMEDYSNLDNLITEYSKLSNTNIVIKNIDFYNDKTATYGTEFGSNEVTFIKPRVELLVLNSGDYKLSYKEYDPYGYSVGKNGTKEQGVDGDYIFDKMYLIRGVASEEIGSGWGSEEVNSKSEGKYRFAIYINDNYVKDAYLTITNNAAAADSTSVRK